MALEVRWPWVREGGGTQTIEPIAQFVAGPQNGRSIYMNKLPNEDSLDFQFTDQNLFSINKFPGLDREEGGCRLNAGLHLNWTAGGTVLDGLVGQSYRTTKDEVSRSAAGWRTRCPTS